MNLYFQTITQQLESLVSLLNAILSGTQGIGKRSIAENRLGINRRILSDKLQNIGSTLTDTNTKSSSIQDSINNMNVDSIRSMSNSINGKTVELKGTTEEIGRKMFLIDITSNHIIERVWSIKGNINHGMTMEDSAQRLTSDSDVKTDVIEKLTLSLINLANMLERKLVSLQRN